MFGFQILKGPVYFANCRIKVAVHTNLSLGGTKKVKKHVLVIKTSPNSGLKWPIVIFALGTLTIQIAFQRRGGKSHNSVDRSTIFRALLENRN